MLLMLPTAAELHEVCTTGYRTPAVALMVQLLFLSSWHATTVALTTTTELQAVVSQKPGRGLQRAQRPQKQGDMAAAAGLLALLRFLACRYSGSGPSIGVVCTSLFQKRL